MSMEYSCQTSPNCRAANGELINVEMCFNPSPYEPVRMEFHTAKLFVGQDIRGKDKSYNDLKWAYQIAILATKRIFPDDSFIHTFEYYDPAKKVSLNGRTRIISLELSKVGAIMEKAINAMNIQEYWAVFFGCLNDRAQREKINAIIAQEEGIAMASEVLLTISRDEEERARIMRDEKIELDWNSYMTEARRKGLREGHEEGLREGRQEGIELEKTEVIRNLLSMKIPVEKIAQAVQLPIEKVQAIGEQ